MRIAHPLKLLPFQRSLDPGSAKKLQKVKDAYDYLISAPEVKVWDEGRRQYGASGSSSSGFPPPPPSTKPRPDPARRELIIGGIAGATLVSILIATQVVNTERRDAPRPNKMDWL